MRYVLPFRELDLRSVPEVGGKNASLGELLQQLEPKGIAVPDGFAVTASAFRLHLERSELAASIYSALDRLNVEDVAELARVGREIRERVRSAPLPAEVEAELLEAYGLLSSRFGQEATDVAVRSSATAEDLPTASFAGQQETYLNVCSAERLIETVRACMASLFTDRAIVYRAERGFDHRQVALSVGVQKMVRSDLASAGVIFTLDTESGFRDAVIITGAWGLGETVVQGRVNPDEFWVHKPTLNLGYSPIVRRQFGDKATSLVYSADGAAVAEQAVTVDRRRAPTLSDAEILQLARWALTIEEHYSAKAGHPTPMDLEWAKDGRSGRLFIVQARPETVHSQKGPPKLESFEIQGARTPLVIGKSVGGKIDRAGADALELNVYRVSTDPERSSAELEDETVAMVRAAVEATSIPVAVKLSPFYASLPHLAHRLVDAGAKGLVLFNRFYQPDIDLDRLEVTPRIQLSTSAELSLRLRWVAVLSAQLRASLAVTGGVHAPEDALKSVLVGADAVQLVSEVIQHGFVTFTRIRNFLAMWLEERGYQSLSQVHDTMNHARSLSPGAYERANYLHVLHSYPPVRDTPTQ